MHPPHITEAEWTVMESLWEISPQTATEVYKQVRKETNWAENTVRTVLTRLLERGVLRASSNDSGVRIYSPAFSRETFVEREGDSFLNRVFKGAANPLLIHFAKQATLTPEEVREMKRILDQKLTKKT